jgi:hypothetical protein
MPINPSRSTDPVVAAAFLAAPVLAPGAAKADICIDCEAPKPSPAPTPTRPAIR